MSRFFMTKKQAVSLIFHATDVTLGGEIFVIKMPAIKITKMADVIIKYLGNDSTRTRKIGIRSGEKIFEVLVSRYHESNDHPAAYPSS